MRAGTCRPLPEVVSSDFKTNLPVFDWGQKPAVFPNTNTLCVFLSFCLRGEISAKILTLRDSHIYFKPDECDWGGKKEKKKKHTWIYFKLWDSVLKQGKKQKVEEERIKYLCTRKAKQYNFGDTVAKRLFIPHLDWQMKQVGVILKWLLIRVTSPLQSGLWQFPSEISIGKKPGRLQARKNTSH